jgi:predicted ATPase
VIAQLEAYNYRCLKMINQSLERFHILIGRNATGKSTFLDILGFLQDMLWGGLDLAVYGAELDVNWFVPRTERDFRDLLHKKMGGSFTLALVAWIPERLQEKHKPRVYDRVRYQIRVGFDEEEILKVLDEHLWLLEKDAPMNPLEGEAVSSISDRQEKLWNAQSPRSWENILQNKGGNAHFWSETKTWSFPLKLSEDMPALSNLPEDEEQFPVSVWLKRFLRTKIQRLQLNPRSMRKPCPALASEEFELDGSNLPKVVHRLKKEETQSFKWWLEHVQQELNDLEDIDIRQRPEDNAFYLVLRYQGGYEVPQWGISDGTLRFLVLTLLSYLPETGATWLIEEPENGIHPQALELVLQSLSNFYENQVFVATHSPLLLGFEELIKPEHLLIFSLEKGETIIRSGSEAMEGMEREGSGLTLGDLMAWGAL